jgi:hypothetical protein
MNPDLRASACTAAGGVVGVKAVVNKITTLPNSPADNRIRVHLLSAIYSDARLLRYAASGPGGAIHILVDHGRVTLEGEVAVLSDARRVVERAGSVQGVVSISDRLSVVN